jgi:hypothetical protein
VVNLRSSAAAAKMLVKSNAITQNDKVTNFIKITPFALFDYDTLTLIINN